MCHLSLTQLLFIARFWNEEAFSFLNVLPGLETSERKGDISNEGYDAHHFFEKIVCLIQDKADANTVCAAVLLCHNI